MRRRRTLGATLGAAVVIGALVPAVHMVLAAAPHDATLPDFGSSEPIVQTVPGGWDLEVVTGGVHAGDKVSFTFLYNGKPADRTHAVNFQYLGGDADGLVTVGTLGSLPAGVPLPPPPTQQCVSNSGSDRTPLSTDVNPYSQTITLTLAGDQPANTVMVYCFNNGIVGFPIVSDSGYSIRYTEPGGSTDTPPYKVQPQQAPAATSVSGGAVTSTLITLTDHGGAEVTDTGLGGSQPGLYNAAYNIKLSGTASNIYSVTGAMYEAASAVNDHTSTVAITGVGGESTACHPGTNELCGDTSGFAYGTVTLNSKNTLPDYLIIKVNDRSDAVSSIATLTLGPPNSTAPTPEASETPIPGSSPPPPPVVDTKCKLVITSQGLGAPDLLDAFETVLIPEANAACPELANTFSFIGSNNDHAIAEALGNPETMYAFAGLDRSLTADEYASYGAVTSTQNLGVQHFPVLIEPLVVSYNLTGCGNVGQVNLRSAVLSGIFTGAINRWSDPTIAVDNPNLRNCNLPILVAHDIGTPSMVLKDYMSKKVGLWNAYKQPQTENVWPGTATVSCTANGSKAMALCVTGQPGMIGYGYYRDMVGAGLPVAGLEAGAATSQASGVDFMSAPLDASKGCSNAAVNNPTIPQTTSSDWSSASLTDMPLTYPLCSFEYIVAATKCHFHVGYNALRAFLGAVLTPQVQDDLTRYGLAPLPAHVIDIGRKGYGDTTTDPTVLANPQPLGC